MFRYLEGKIIYIFGIDGSGKTTLLNSLSEFYEKHINVNKVLSDNSGGAFTKDLENLETKYGINKKKDLSSQFENIVYTLDHLYKVIKYLEPNKKCLNILDRYYICNWVFSKLTNEDTEIIERIHSLFPKPDYFIYLDVDWEIAWQRIQKRNKKITLKEQPQNLKKAIIWYETYLNRFDIDAIRINANKNPINIFQEVIGRIR